MKHFISRDHALYDGDTRLRYLHWAGTPMRPGGPYRDLWEYYRYLDDPDGRPLAGKSPSQLQRQPIRKLKQAIGRLARRMKK